jgi:hypothetical protein
LHGYRKRGEILIRQLFLPYRRRIQNCLAKKFLEEEEEASTIISIKTVRFEKKCIKAFGKKYVYTKPYSPFSSDFFKGSQ